MLRVEVTEEGLLRLIRAVKEELGSYIIVYNCSPLDPEDHTHNYHGLDDTLSLRIRQLHLALIGLSLEEGISIVDVERIAAEFGEESVPSALTYSDQANAAICKEFVRILADIGFFEARPLMMQIGRSK